MTERNMGSIVSEEVEEESEIVYVGKKKARRI